MTGFCTYLWQRSLATDLRNLSMDLRRKQSAYLKRLQQQQEVATLNVGQILNSSYYPPMFYCSFFLYLFAFFFVELLLFFLSFYFSIGIVFR
jgi:hypothetical protein